MEDNMDQAQINEWFTEIAVSEEVDNPKPLFPLTELTEQFLLIAEESLDMGGPTTLKQYGACLAKYTMTQKLDNEQKDLAKRIYTAYIKSMICHEEDDYFMDDETICCGIQCRLPRLPLPRKYRGAYDLSQAAIQLEIDRAYWALPHPQREEWHRKHFIWTCRGCYRKAFSHIEEDGGNFDKRGRFRPAAYTEFNVDYIKCMEENEANPRTESELLKEAKAAIEADAAERAANVAVRVTAAKATAAGTMPTTEVA
jgi:hypothetical protein